MHGIKRSAEYYEKGKQEWRDKFDEAAKRLTALKKGVDYPQAEVTLKARVRSQDARRCRCCREPILRLSTAARFCSLRCKRRYHKLKEREQQAACA